MSHHKAKYVKTKQASVAVLLEYLISVGAEQTAELLDAIIGADTAEDDTTAFESLQERLPMKDDGSSMQFMVECALQHTKAPRGGTCTEQHASEGTQFGVEASRAVGSNKSSADSAESPLHGGDGRMPSTAVFPALASPPAALDSVPHSMEDGETYFSPDRVNSALGLNRAVQEELSLESAGRDALSSSTSALWTKAEVALLKASLRRYPAALYGKNERFAAIAGDVGRPKKECFTKFRELLQAKRNRAAAPRSPDSRTSSPACSSASTDKESSDQDGDPGVDVSNVQSL
jgi:hypothetical protein